MKFYYVNSKGRRINFYEYPFIMQEGNLLNYSYSYDSTAGSRPKLLHVRKGVGERSFKLALLPNIEAGLSYSERRNALKTAADELFEAFEYDVVNNINGALWTDTGYYLPCRILASDKDNNGILNGLPFAFETFKAVSDVNAWIRPVIKSFYIGSGITAENADADYPYDYSYDYAQSKSGIDYFNTHHFAECDFKMVIYGPVSNPVVNINNYPYTVHTDAENGEYFIIDSKAGTVEKVLSAGECINVFNLRGKEHSVFKKLPPGDLTVTWNGNFGFDITAFVERSEPSWS